MIKQMEEGGPSEWGCKPSLFVAKADDDQTESSAEGDKVFAREKQAKSAAAAAAAAAAAHTERFLDVLPLNTKVRVIGNKRTSHIWVGKVGVVVKTACLGGWHKLKMDSGETVKVQRNGLDVIDWGDGRKPVDVSDSDEGCKQAKVGLLEEEGLYRGWTRGVRQMRTKRRLPRMMNVYSETPGRVNLSRLNDAALKRYLLAFGHYFPPDVERVELLWRSKDLFDSTEVDELEVAQNMHRKRLRT